MGAAISLESRAWSRVAKAGLEDCWNWTGTTGGKGGPCITTGRRTMSARRVIWESATGQPVPANRHVVPSCKNSLCVNPVHLYLKPFMDHEARFWSFVQKADGDACWLWKSTFFASGYAAFGMNGKEQHASRVAWEFTNGPIVGHVAGHPELEVCVCHRCDNPKCVRPDHLFLGHDRDNIADMHAKGRNSRGAEHAERTRKTRARKMETQEAMRRDPMLMSKPMKTAWLAGAGWTIQRKRGEPMWFIDPMGLDGPFRVEQAFELQIRRERSGVSSVLAGTEGKEGNG